MLNHLWQSTLFALAAGLLTLALRGNRARVRYWIWLAASVKFLLPFSLLLDAGSNLRWRTEARSPIVLTMVDRATDVLAPIPTAPLPLVRPSSTPFVFGVLWACGSLTVAAAWLIRWRRAQRSGPVLEPGVYGLFQPVVRMPDGIEAKLTDPQLKAVFAHEMAHVRWRDNLTAAIHMSVEVLFWFHPLVWWIGTRLIDERERSCDEEVLRLGHEPDTYAEGVLRVCKHYLEMPVTCVAGVTGSNLERRIEDILANRKRQDLGLGRKAVLAVSAVAAFAGPLLVGVWNAPPLLAQTTAGAKKFAVATIKPAKSGVNGSAIGTDPSGDFMVINQSLTDMVAYSFIGEIAILGRVTGGPDWAKSARFDIHAKADQFARQEDFRVMLRALLEDRFKLKTHEETRQLPLYALVVKNKGKFGEGLRLSPPEEAAFCDAQEKEPTEEQGPPTAGGFRRCSGSGRGGIRLRGRPMKGLETMLAELLGKPVIDRTGLEGRYDVDLLGKFNWDHLVEGGPIDELTNGEVFTAIEDQLGLKIESTRGPVRVVVIDSAERPGEN